MTKRHRETTPAVRFLLLLPIVAAFFAAGCGKAPIRVGGKATTAYSIDSPYWTRVGDETARRPDGVSGVLASAQVRLHPKGKKNASMSPGIGTTTSDGEFNVQIPLTFLDSVDQVRLSFRLDGYKPQFIDFNVSDLRKAEILSDGRKIYIECWLPPTDPQ
jgi:hypothetical protein